MTKPVTSVAVMMLVEEGRIRLNDPVSKYLPSFANRAVVTRFDEKTSALVTGPSRTAVTIKHLLTNTAGIAYPFSNRIAQVLQKTAAGKRDIELPLVHVLHAAGRERKASRQHAPAHRWKCDRRAKSRTRGADGARRLRTFLNG
jgi:CubicO group peptidase (beta-lactamase class C family)